MKLEIGALPIRGKVVSRSDLPRAYESSEFQSKLKSSYIENAFNNSIKDGLKAIGELFIEHYKDHMLSKKVSTTKEKLKKGRRHSYLVNRVISSVYYRVVQ